MAKFIRFDESLVRGIAAGLVDAHQPGFLDRDIKPQNVWLDAESSQVRLLDFRRVREFQPSPNGTGQASGDVICGTPRPCLRNNHEGILWTLPLFCPG